VRALVCHAFGPVADLTIGDLPDPIPGPGEVLIDVAAAGVNFPDVLIAQGLYQFKPEPPFAPGGEVVGRIAALGPGTTGFAVGDRVVAMTFWGAFAERLAVPAARVTPCPPGLDDATAAGFLLTYGTAYHALVDRAGLAPGERLLVLGAAGGVGLAACEIGAALGATVTAAASTAEKRAVALAHGATRAMGYTAGDARAAMKADAPEGYDVVFDPVGGAHSEAALRATAWGGRFLVVGFAAGEIPRVPLNLPLLKGCAIVGVFWGSFVERAPAQHRANMARIADWLAEGRLRPRIEAVLPLAEGAEALRRLAARDVRGKLVLRVRDLEKP